MPKKTADRARQQRDVNELLNLYHAWFAVLMRRLGAGEHRFREAEITEVLKENCITVRKEGCDYVVCLEDTDGHNRKEVAYGKDT